MNLSTLPRRRAASPLARWGRDGRLRALVATAPPVVAPPAERTPQDQTFPPPEGGVPFVVPVAMLEGWETSDGRFWEPGGVGRRDMPQTLMAMLRNPDGGVGHDAAVAVGRLDSLERYDASEVLNRETGQPYGPGVFAWRAAGYLAPHADQPGSVATVQYIKDRVLRGVSVDLAEIEGYAEVLEEDEEGNPEKVRLVATQSSIGQMTVTPFAAFPGAYIELADEEPLTDEEVPPVAEPGQAGAASVHRVETVVASAGVAPILPPEAWFKRQSQLNPSRHVYLGRREDGTPTGQVWGYIAEWGVAHAGILDREVLAPRLGQAGYRSFLSRGSTYTAEGTEVGTGILTFGGGHANTALGIMPALAHYDEAGAAYADVVVGEDDFGVWFAGAMRSTLTREEMETFAKHPISGDWRADPGDRDVRLIAACSVNTPGFRIGARSHIAASGVRTLVAAGSSTISARARRAEAGGIPAAEVEAMMTRLLQPVLASAARAGLDRLTRGR